MHATITYFITFSFTFIASVIPAFVFAKLYPSPASSAA